MVSSVCVVDQHSYDATGALLIAGHFAIPEVTLYFANKLLRGNRSIKVRE